MTSKISLYSKTESEFIVVRLSADTLLGDSYPAPDHERFNCGVVFSGGEAPKVMKAKNPKEFLKFLTSTPALMNVLS